MASAFANIVALANWTHASVERVEATYAGRMAELKSMCTDGRAKLHAELKSTCTDAIAEVPSLAAELVKAEQQQVIESQTKRIEALEAQLLEQASAKEVLEAQLAALVQRVAKLEQS